MLEKKLPADPSTLIIGILGIVIGLVGCCCYGFTAIIPLGLSIYGLVAANKSLKLYRANPEEYSDSSRSNVSISKILNIISIIMNGLFFLVVIGFIAAVGVAGFQGAFDDIRNGTYGESNDWEYEDYDTDSTYDDDVYEYEVEEVDTLDVDTSIQEEIIPENDTIKD